MTTMFFDEEISIRLIKGDKEKILKIIESKKLKYESLSHFIRCAVRILIKQESE